MKARSFLHPVVYHQRSRIVLGWFLMIGAVVTWVSWRHISRAAAEAGVGALGAQAVIIIAIVLAAVFLLAGMTAAQLVGAGRRIEQWLRSWHKGERVEPLRLRGRRNDQLERLIELINALHQKITS